MLKKWNAAYDTFEGHPLTILELRERAKNNQEETAACHASIFIYRLWITRSGNQSPHHRYCNTSQWLAHTIQRVCCPITRPWSWQYSTFRWKVDDVTSLWTFASRRIEIDEVRRGDLGEIVVSKDVEIWRRTYWYVVCIVLVNNAGGRREFLY